jgi:hypothetical protein
MMMMIMFQPPPEQNQDTNTLPLKKRQPDVCSKVGADMGAAKKADVKHAPLPPSSA